MGNDANGFLLPSWYVAEQPTDFDLGIASSILGFSLACAVFTFVKALRQTWKMHRRGKVRNAYIIMVWAEWLVCVIISIVSWLYLSTSQSVLPGFWLFFWLCKCRVSITVWCLPLMDSISGSLGCTDSMYSADYHQPSAIVDG